ncbi:MAG TPA: helix-turn-helix domain-containing protein, partial [Chitinophagaceae bacterium]|nr:helix-turn-helix domain-containing protein [Chitinophagaceae bacterium]
MIFNIFNPVMKLTITDQKTGGDLLLISGEQDFDRLFYTRDKEKKYFTIAWNYGEKQTVTIDGEAHDFMPHTILPLMFNQSFYFERAGDIVAWQFNREFYCIIDHDAEVSCVGFLFGIGDQLFISLDDAAQYKLQLLLNVFIEELNTKDNIQNDMLLMLLKRLIIVITQLARSKYIPDQKLQDDRLDIFRKFNLLVEAEFRTAHTVNYYAQRLNKSPKTLSNLFALYNRKTPLQMIQERIIIEAKRLLYYTGKSVKQITYELGFEDPA